MNHTSFDEFCYKIAPYVLVIGFINLVFLACFILASRHMIPTMTEANMMYNGFKGVI